MNWKKWALILGWLLGQGPPPLAAHGLFTFAWVEGPQICTESYFSRQSQANGARISMLDAAGAVLASGLTDSTGGYCFERPVTPQKLTFVVETAGGHRGEFELPAEVFPAAEDQTALAARDEPGRDEAESAGGQAEPLELPALRRMVREELRAELAAQLGPLNRRLAAGENRAGPGLKEVFSGLGWLAGLAGLGFWLAARRGDSPGRRPEK